MKLQGQTYIINGNEPILLNDPSRVWVVQSGSMALFAVTVKDGVIDGTRRYLCSISQGEALFGTVYQQRQILAVPIGEVELLLLHPECFRGLGAKANAWIENWLMELSSVLCQIPTPKIQVKTEGQERFSLNNGQNFQPAAGLTCWVQLQEGNVCFLGFEELILATDVAFPMNDKMWLTPVGGVQLTTHTTSEYENSDILLAGLSQLHTQILSCVTLLDEQEAQAELTRLQERQRLNRRVTAEALGELSSTLNSQDGDFFLEGTPLLVAAGAVGRAMGIKISPPLRSENLQRVKEPLEAIVRASRIRMRRVLLRDNWWLKDAGALVAYTKENQPVALLPAGNRYEIFDPVNYSRVVVNEGVAATLAPVAYMFYRSLPDKALRAIDIVKFTLRGHGWDLLQILFTGIFITLLGMITPYATSIIIDNAIPDSDRSLLLQIGLGLLVAALGAGLFQLAQGFALLRMETSGDASTQAGVWDRLLNLPVSFFREYTTGDLLSRISSVSAIRRQLSGRTLINFITSIFALFYLGQLFYYNYKLALIAVASAVVAIAITTISGILLLSKVRPLLEVQGNIFGQTVQLINGISKLHIAGAEERAFAAWSKNYTRQIKLELSTQLVEDFVVIFNTIIPIITSGVLFWFTTKLLEEAQTSGSIAFSLGTFLAFNTAFSNFTRGTTNLSNTVTQILQILPQWQRTQPILTTIPEVNLSKSDPGRLAGKITVDNVTFCYRRDGNLTLDNVSISAEPGEFIALVGSSGSGKSTLLRLLLGFETPQAGSIHYDGQDLSGLDVDAVRRQLGVVLQNGQLNSASIFENIAGDAQITLDEAWEAARMSGFAEDVTAMPMQMHTVVSEGGGNLSGGQRQRLLIARALALKPRILLFDEATSALDNRTQAIVSESLDKLQVTRIAIAHRLSTIRNAHRIYVLQAGRVVQQGTFQELANTEGIFAQLMARQMA
ncbi:NHLP bacteriocin export ABC transporter permease/ATPase subunit [Anabaena sp. FACHB-709]|uniref:ABC transporter ATP-binding protein n=2 Tax=Nostocaceae TaxID=1162 RepID=A0A1Z4KFB1_ANAVA|nr:MULTISPECIES: NHLP bacteriocin export ABC transporter permease/ATPase subunit [Nostocaceae]BAY67639.1 ABC transporter ATP-binding protein [Trichormus variabilis NIES-23]HBW33042.1 NHLP bacteriocin export ABC transporter permease/ATPase subunit [Nostoc sp. UBA8866]MBD2173932.1 NHLP bacteriocin export ABC transporter permease/ATPase subunit [Anabaena cylindrica FACHB-318]MBD2265680.1 NHLP bacteriocin export ABC transporter permease/ATPase subunit [Anabaena sp. FACHB-709]MBD2275037.1 NHLP bact